MNHAVQLFSENNYIVSIANLGGVIAFIVLIFAAGKWTLNFLKTAYRQDIKAAIWRAKRRNFVIAHRCALDLHEFVAFIAMFGVAIAWGALTVVVGLLGTAVTEIQAIASDASSEVSWWDRAADIFAVSASGLLMTLASFMLFFLARRTRRIRAKLVARQWRMNKAAKEAV